MSRLLIPNSTQIPDVILDAWMAELSGGEFKVLLYIARRTYGFGKESDGISLTQMAQGITRRDGTVLDRGTGLSRASVARALKCLEDRGVIVRQTNLSESGREFEENTYRINLNWEPKGGEGEPFDPPPSTLGGTPGERPGAVAGPVCCPSGAVGGVVSKCDYLVSKCDRGWSQNETTVVSKLDIQETDLQETDQETASAKAVADPGTGGTADAAALLLIEELVSHGVGRTTAARLARGKPEACRRCLEYLPYAEVRTTKGAWLANAIRDEYGPPEGFEQARKEQETRARKRGRPQKPRQGHQDARSRANDARLRVAYARMEEARGEAYTAFNDYVERKRAQAARIAAHLSPRRREEHFAGFGEPEHRAWPERVHKQALVTEALQPLFARRGRPRELILDTALLPGVKAMKDPAGTFEQFLLWERAARDTLEVKRLYIDMAGDLVAGVVLSQIVYWHLPSREGKARLQVEKEGKLWLAKGRSEWWDECRISPKQADRALDALQERGLIEVRLFKFGTAPTKHVRIRHEEFLRAWKAQLARETGGGPAGEGGADCRPRSSSILTKGENRFSPKVKIHFDQRVKSKDTETTTETTSAAAEGARVSAAADAVHFLTEELVSHGVGRATAHRLAREKPDVCRRCLAYLPYAEVRTTKGAWLANAIRDEYGPPPGFEQARKEQEKQASKRARPQKPPQSHEDARSRANDARLRVAYARMEQARGEAYTAFNDYVEQKRTQAARIAAHLSARRREEHLAGFDEPEHRLRLFEEWLRSRDGPVGQEALFGEPAVPSMP